MYILNIVISIDTFGTSDRILATMIKQVLLRTRRPEIKSGLKGWVFRLG